MEITKMSAQEIILVKVFAELAEEAFKDEKLIKEHFDSAFGIGNKIIYVFGNSYGDGYLTIDGVFKYHEKRRDGRSYEFSCDAEGIYRMLRSCYLRKNKLDALENEKFECQIENMDSYFREFIKTLNKDSIEEEDSMLQMNHRISKENAAMLIKKLEASRFGESTKMTVEEAMKLSPIGKAPVGGYELYAIQVDNSTLLFWFANGSCYMKERCW